MIKESVNGKVNSVITFSAIVAIVDRVSLILEYFYIGGIIDNILLGILFIFSCMFFMSWAVMGKRKTYVVCGSLFLFFTQISYLRFKWFFGTRSNC